MHFAGRLEGGERVRDGLMPVFDPGKGKWPRECGRRGLGSVVRKSDGRGGYWMDSMGWEEGSAGTGFGASTAMQANVGVCYVV